MNFEKKIYKDESGTEWEYDEPVPKVFVGKEIAAIHTLGCDNKKNMSCVFHTADEKFLKVENVEYLVITSPTGKGGKPIQFGQIYEHSDEGSEIFLEGLDSLHCKITGKVIMCEKEE